MKFFIRRAGYTFFDYERNEEILEEVEVEPFDEKPRKLKSNWLRHVTRMNSNRMPEIVRKYGRSNGRKRLGRSLKRLLDEAETGLSSPNW